MKKLLLSIFVACAVASSALALTYNEAATQDKPVVVMFHMHGCSACRKFSPTFDKFASKFSNKFNFVKENVDNSKIGSTLKFDTVPALFIIQPKTQAATRISNDCAWDKACLTKTLEEYK